MKKLVILMLSIFLVVGGVGLGTAAKNNAKPDALATIMGMGCDEDFYDDENGLLVQWSWLDGDGQTKFGGDAVYMVDATINEGEFPSLAVEVEIELFDPLNISAGTLIYRCGTLQSDSAGECIGAILDVETALINAIVANLPEDVDTDPSAEEISITINSYILNWVKVKAMNPGSNSGRQNYPLVNVCDVPPAEPVVSP